MIEINTLGAFIGMGIVSVGVAILWFLADKNHGKARKIKHTHHNKVR